MTKCTKCNGVFIEEEFENHVCGVLSLEIFDTDGIGGVLMTESTYFDFLSYPTTAYSLLKTAHPTKRSTEPLLNLQNKRLKVDGLIKIGLGLGNLSKFSIILFETKEL
jgi:hypothetical protein